MESPFVVGLGEVLWDLLPDGPSPGGAPANFVYNATAIGAQGVLASAVGDDERGRDLRDCLAARSVCTDLLTVVPGTQTGTAEVVINEQGDPAYVIPEGVAWDRIPTSARLLAAAARADAICFNSLAQRSPVARESIRALLRVVPPQAIRLFDANLRSGYYSAEVLVHSFEMANAAKINEKELHIIGKLLQISGDERRQVEVLSERWGLHHVALTRGSRGATLMTHGKYYDAPGEVVDVRDTVGAGDAFAAALTVGLLGGRDPQAVVLAANHMAAFVCTQSGAFANFPDSIRNLFH